jgi:hypothetical protein
MHDYNDIKMRIINELNFIIAILKNIRTSIKRHSAIKPQQIGQWKNFLH